MHFRPRPPGPGGASRPCSRATLRPRPPGPGPGGVRGRLPSAARNLRRLPITRPGGSTERVPDNRPRRRALPRRPPTGYQAARESPPHPPGARPAVCPAHGRHPAPGGRTERARGLASCPVPPGAPPPSVPMSCPPTPDGAPGGPGVAPPAHGPTSCPADPRRAPGARALPPRTARRRNRGPDPAHAKGPPLAGRACQSRVEPWGYAAAFLTETAIFHSTVTTRAPMA